MTSTVTIQGVTMARDAATSVEECGVDVAEDVRRLRSGEITREQLLAECLDGADDDRVSAWHEYVSAVAMAVES